jgi:hypothetical protein
MALDVLIGGANLDAGGNTKVALSQNPLYAGVVRMFSENDPGDVTGSAYLKSPETSPDFRIRTGVDTELFRDTFNGTTQNTNLWYYAFVTMTASQPGAGYLQFATVQGTAGTHGAYMRTFQYFPLTNTGPLAVEFVAAQATAVLAANEVWHMGLGTPGGAVTKPTDGVYWQITTAGIEGIIAYNGTYTSTGVLLPLNSLNLNDYDKFTIVIGEREVEWWHKDIMLQEQAIPVAQGIAMIAPAQPMFMQKYCTGVVSNTNVMRVQRVGVTLMDLEIDRSWPHSRSIAGQSSLVGQNGHTQGKTQWWTNNTGPTAAAATNTAAIAGATTLGGLVAVLPTLAVNSDGILFVYQNPAPTVNITGRNLIITGVKVQGAVSVILAGGPVCYAYAVAFGHTAATLVTGETATFATATTHAPRIAFVGMETYPATAAVGTIGQGAQIVFDAPICVRPGEFVALIARNLGVVTTTGAITVGATFTGYFE